MFVIIKTFHLGISYCISMGVRITQKRSMKKIQLTFTHTCWDEAPKEQEEEEQETWPEDIKKTK